MPSLKTHIVLICVLAGYFITVECRNYLKDSYKNSPDINLKKTLNSHSAITNWLNNLLTKGKLKNIGKSNAIKALIAKLNKNEKGNKKRWSKRNLRNGIEVQEFLHKLNNFINQNTHNAYYEIRNDCNFGFGKPSKACKRHKSRRNAVKKSKKSRNNKEKDYNNYTQHLVVERSRYRSSSSSSENETPVERQKSRFKIVHNDKRKKVSSKSSESEDQSRESYSDESDDINKLNESDEKPNESYEKPNESYEKPNESYEKHYESNDKPNSFQDSNSDADTDATVENNQHTANSDESANENTERESSVKHPDTEYMYLQGTRLQKPDFRAGRGFKRARRHDRLPYFLPKRFKWDDDMIHHLDTYWRVGIGAYDSSKKYRTNWH
ncbi:uncharacterized membrane protein-like [Cydia fagiglandana]|uniref:uncharacterized membrane protein-like n=1 Tax=Cydia fagiglandana TaxID=1458189 RepID=UPI002FEE5411